jgi:hypothetical protein
MAITLGPLIDEALDSSRSLGNGFLLSAATDRLIQRALQIRSEVRRFRALPRALRIATHALCESERRRRAAFGAGRDFSQPAAGSTEGEIP